MEATQGIMEFFHKPDQILSKEIPFSKQKWYLLLSYMKITHLFNPHESLKDGKSAAETEADKPQDSGDDFGSSG